MISVIIPTLNRPNDLSKAVRSICTQTRKPDELIVVDQSLNFKAKQLVTKILSAFPDIKLIYIHDHKITGLVEAKQAGVNCANGDIIFFLEDDVVLESNYIEEMITGFLKYPYIIGCSGVITNPPNVNFLYKFLFVIFHRGIFKDKRIDINGIYIGYSNSLIKSDMLSGGLSAWRREVFDKVEFDVANGFHMLEDIDFSTRVARYYGNRLFINPNARLAHYCSPINRDLLGARERRKIRECFTYYKKRKDWPSSAIPFYWLLLGMLLESIFQSFSCLSFKPIQGYLLGFLDGYAKKITS